MDLTKSSTRPAVDVGAYPSFDLLVSLLTFHTPESTETFESGAQWFEDMERQGSAGKEHYIQRKKRQQRLQLELRPNLRQSDCTPRLDLRSAAE